MRICFAVEFDGRKVLIRARPRPLEDGLEIIGLAAARARSTRDRVWSMLSNGPGVPGGALVEIRPPIKAGTATLLDIPIALAVLAVNGEIRPNALAERLRNARERYEPSGTWEPDLQVGPTAGR